MLLTILILVFNDISQLVIKNYVSTIQCFEKISNIVYEINFIDIKNFKFLCLEAFLTTPNAIHRKTSLNIIILPQ